MANQSTEPKAHQPAAADKPEPMTATPKLEPTPLNPPLVFYNLKWRVPALLVDTQEEADAMDPAEWTQQPPPAGKKSVEAKYPQIYYDVNVPPIVVNSANDLKTLDQSRYRPFPMTKGIADAAEENLKAATHEHAPKDHSSKS